MLQARGGVMELDALDHVGLLVFEPPGVQVAVPP